MRTGRCGRSAGYCTPVSSNFFFFCVFLFHVSRACREKRERGGDEIDTLSSFVITLDLSVSLDP